MRGLALTAVLLLVAACPKPAPLETATCGDWLQWGAGPAHVGGSCVAAQPPARKVAELVSDPFAAAEKAENDGELTAHYQAPLALGDDVYIEVKAGDYVACRPPGSGTPEPCGVNSAGTLRWTEQRLHWDGDALTPAWSFPTDWQPAPTAWEAVFQPALAGDYLVVPGAGGTVFQVGRGDGVAVRRVNPFGADVDATIYVSSALAADARGNVWYTALQLDPADPWRRDATGWLVRVAPDGTFASATFTSLTPGAPAAGDACVRQFSKAVTPRPWPPPDGADGKPTLPPSGPCGSQRPGVNAAPAIGADGTVFVVSRAHFSSRYSYVVAVRPDLTPSWATSLRDLVADGCGVLVPQDDSDTGCRKGSAVGVDPLTNQRPALRVDDTSSASPVALPDGGVVYGALTLYNDFRGHLVKLGAAGAYLGAYDFGWDTTPAVRAHDGTYSIVTKDNHYVYDAMGVPQGPYYLTQLSKDLLPEWKFQATNTESCAEDAAGALACTSDHPHGFEWCINAPALDASGVLYANSEDGRLYAVGPDGAERGHLFLHLALGAAYTPLALDRAGRIYAQNDGRVFVLGR